MKNRLAVEVLKCSTFKTIQHQLYGQLNKYELIFPQNRASKILLKPNLNSNMNALTGNTTDLRVLAVVVKYLKDQGYTDITIAEGTNSGFYRTGISVIARLKVDALAKFFGVRCIDLNMSDPILIPFEDDVQAGVARECLEAEFFINMPKLKTHFEAGMSACLKNLIGCLVGQENKKKAHLSLAANIVNINEHVRPHFHIVDSIFAMEGLGPTKGTPVKTERVMVGTDPYLLDLLAARFAKFDYRKISPLAKAEERGIIDKTYHDVVKNYPLDLPLHAFKSAKAGAIATFIHSPKRQKYFFAIRNTRIFNYLCNTEVVGKLLFLTDLRQDVFITEEMNLQRITYSPDLCIDCGRCQGYCPVELDLPNCLHDKEVPGCIQCLYCFCVCPEKAIGLEGDLGFMKEQLDQYDEIIRKIS